LQNILLMEWGINDSLKSRAYG